MTLSPCSDDARDRVTVAAARAALTDDLRAVVAQHRLGAFLADVEALAGPAGGDALPDDLARACVALHGVLARLDRGPADREWRSRDVPSFAGACDSLGVSPMVVWGAPAARIHSHQASIGSNGSVRISCGARGRPTRRVAAFTGPSPLPPGQCGRAAGGCRGSPQTGPAGPPRG